MRKLINLSYLILLAGMIAMSCSKSTDEPLQQTPVVKGGSNADFLLTPEGNAELARITQKYLEVNPQYKNSEFVMPFFTSDGFAIARDIVIDCEVPGLPPGVCLIVGGELALFSAPYGPQDFWKVNPDGTTTVHMSSKEASAVYIDFESGEFYSGEGCHLTRNYTGEFVEEVIINPFTGEEVTIYYFDFENSPSAVTSHGNGKVQLEGTGPKSNLIIKSVSTSGGQYNTTLNFN